MLDKFEFKAARARRGFTQKALAEATGITPAKMSMKENGHLNFTVKDIDRIAKVLKLTPTDVGRIFFADVVALKDKSVTA